MVLSDQAMLYEKTYTGCEHYLEKLGDICKSCMSNMDRRSCPAIFKYFYTQGRIFGDFLKFANL